MKAGGHIEEARIGGDALETDVEGAIFSSVRVRRNMLVLKRAFRSGEWRCLSVEPRFQRAVTQMRTMDEAESVIKFGLVLLDELVERSKAA
jgi:hypothetical protein